MTEVEGEITPKGHEKDFTISIVRKNVNSTKRSIKVEYSAGITALIRDLVSEKSLIGMSIKGFGISRGLTPSLGQKFESLIFLKMFQYRFEDV